MKYEMKSRLLTIEIVNPVNKAKTEETSIKDEREKNHSFLKFFVKNYKKTQRFKFRHRHYHRNITNSNCKLRLVLSKFLDRTKLGMIRYKTTICLILQDMFGIHHPSSVANTE